MKRIFTPSLLFLILLSCNPPANRPEETNEEAETFSKNDAHNTLSEAEQSEGWRLLFDGQTFEGWRSYNNADQNSWEIQNGTLHCKAFDDNGPNMRADLITEEEFSDFELQFEWKVAPQSNTGIMYRVTEKHDQPYKTGPEFQLIDDTGYPGEMKDWQRTGACYDMYAPAPVKMNPAGEWNSGKLIVQGNHIEHWVNGVQVVSYDLQSQDWQKRKSQGKWKDAADYGSEKKGRIDLQDHQMEAWFRNLKIRSL